MPLNHFTFRKVNNLNSKLRVGCLNMNGGTITEHTGF